MIRDDLIQLVSSVILNKENDSLSKSEELEKVCCEQNISAFLYYKFKDANYKKYYLASQLKNKFYDEDVDALIRLFNDNQIKHVLIKGIYIKRFYPVSALRVMGDVDILIFKDDFTRACELLSDNGYETEKHDADHHKSYYNGRIKIELHNKLISNTENDFGIDFSNWEIYAVNESNYTYHLDDTFHFLYIIAHYIKHLKTGTGIRPTIDLYLLYTKTTIDNNKLLDELKQANLLRFWFVIKSSFFVFFEFEMDKPDIETVNMLIDFSMKNWMNGRNPNINHINNADEYYANKNKLRIIFLAVFPSPKKLRGIFGFTKYKILLPLGYLFNFFRLIFTRFKRLLNLLKKHDTDNIYRKVGI